jgi:hypothetical protein
MLPRYELTVWIANIEKELARVEQEIDRLDAISEWTLNQEIEYNDLCKEKGYLEEKYYELYTVLA